MYSSNINGSPEMVIRIVNHLSPNDSHGQRLFNAQCVADFNRFTLNWQTPLQLAAIRKDADACRLLVQAGADADASHPMGNSATALQRACFYSDYDAAKALVFLGASTIVKDAGDMCAFNWAVQFYGG